MRSTIPDYQNPLNVSSAPVSGFRVQTKLKVSRPGDAFEQEADQVADRVVSMQDAGRVSQSRPMIQRKCAACESEDKDATQRMIMREGMTEEDEEVGMKLMRQSDMEEEEADTKLMRETRDPRDEDKREDEVDSLNAKGEGAAAAAPAKNSSAEATVKSGLRSMRGGGRPLSDGVRAYMEPRFGYDFSNVRIHTGARASETARSLNARAFASKRDIVFNDGQFDPDSTNGKRLLAHELTHVIQQGGV